MATDVIKQLRSFFSSKGLILSGHLWQSKPHHHEFLHLARIGGAKAAGKKTPPTVLRKTKRNALYEMVQGEQVFQITFFYLNDFKIALVLDTAIPPELENNDWSYLHQLFYSLYSDELVNMREAELSKMIGGIRAITTSIDLDKLLQEILDNALEVIPAADTGILTMYDPLMDRLVNKALVGIDAKILQNSMKIGEGIVGKTFADGQARIYFTREQVTQDIGNIEKESLDILLSAYDFSKTKAVISIPISLGDKPIGVMVVHQNHTKGTLSDRDVYLLKGFAGQAAIAIENARLIEQLKAQNQFLSKRNQIHETLTRLTLENRGVEAIVAALDEMIKVPLLFVDYLEASWHSRYANPVPLFTMDEIAKLFGSRKSPVTVHLFDGEKREYVVAPIVVDKVFLGCLIAQSDKPLDELAIIALEQGSSVLALELVKKQSMADVYYKKTHEFYRSLLETNDHTLLQTMGDEWGFRQDDHMMVAIFSIRHTQDLRQLEAEVHRLIAGIKRKLGSHRHLVFGFHNKVTLLTMLAAQRDADRACDQIQSVLTEWEEGEGLPVCVGIGTNGQGISEVSKSHDEAQKALQYLMERKQYGLIRYEDLGINRLFLHQPGQEMKAFLEEIFMPLRSEKARQNDLENTLLLFVASNCSANRTAELLHIHINTLYKRLKKIEQALQLSFEKPEDVLKMQLACHLRETFVSRYEKG